MGEIHHSYFCNLCKHHWLFCHHKKIDVDYLQPFLKFPQEFVIIDIETTGLNHETDSIIEVGAVLVNLSSNRIQKVYHSLCNELPKPVNPKKNLIFQISDINYDEVMQAPHFNQIKDDIQKICNTNCVTAFNKSFDFRFLKQRGLTIPHETYDPMKLLTRVLGFLNKKHYLKPPKAQEAWDVLFPNDPHQEAHRALEDAIFEAKILLKIHSIVKEKLKLLN